MILAAGLGTRLRPLTDELPKPLVPVGDAPLLVHITRWLQQMGVGRVVINTHHRPACFEGLRMPLPAAFLHEPRLLGTAGGVANARASLPDEDLVVWNGDLFAEIDLAALRAARERDDADAAWAVAPRPAGQGTVGLDRAGRVVRVRSFRRGEEASGGDFLGVQALSRRLLPALPTEGCLVGDVLGPRVAAGACVVGVPHHGPWDDVGTVASYLRANLRWLRERGLAVHRGEGSAAAPGARLSQVVLGPGARVSGRGEATRLVVWAGGEAAAPLSGAVVTASGRVVRADPLTAG